jgi:hypothetical protein
VTHHRRSDTVVRVRLAVWPIALSTLLAACRLGFDPKEAPSDATADMAPDAALPVLPCGAPTQFAIKLPPGGGSGSGSGTGAPMNPVPAIAATATDGGYYVLAVDLDGNVHGLSYMFSGSSVAPVATDTHVLDGATGTIAAIPVAGGILASIVYGVPDATGTALLPLDAALEPRGTVQRYAGWFGSDGTMARAPDGTLAFIGEATDIAAKLVSPDGVSLGAEHTVIDRNESAREPTITASDTGFLVTWSAGVTSPDEIHAEIFDKQLAAPVVSAKIINPSPMFDGQTARASYATGPDRYLFAWWFKTSMSDEVWVSLRDGSLGEVRAVQLTKRGKFPKVIAGAKDFLVVWQDLDSASGLGAARVGFTGSAQPLIVSGGGGSMLAWDVVSRAGQPALIWFEDAATPTVWLDPLCN